MFVVQAEQPGAALPVEEKINYKNKFDLFEPISTPGYPWVSTQNFSQFGPAV